MIPRYVFAGLLALIALVAVPFGSNRPWAVGLLAIIIGLMLLAMALAAAVNPANLHVPWQRYRVLAWSFLALLAWTLIQATTWTPGFTHHPLWAQSLDQLGAAGSGSISLDRAASVTEAAKFVAYGGVFWLAMQFAGRDRRARILLWTVIFAAVANAVYGLAVHFSGANSILWYRKWTYLDAATGTFVNRNHYATYLGLALIPALCFLLEELRRVSAGYSLRSAEGLLRLSERLSPKLYLLIGVLAVLGLTIVLTGSRGAMAALGAGITAFLCAIALSSRVSGDRVLRLGLVLGAAGLIGISLTGDMLVARLSDASDNLGSRLALFGGVVEAIGQRPLAGTGPGTFNEVFQAHRPAALGADPRGYGHAHNTYLEVALEQGLPALLLLLAMAAVAAVAFLRGVTRRQRNDLLPAVGFGAMALVGVHALFDFSLEIPAVAVTFLVLAGVGFAQALPSGSRIGTARRNDPPPPAAND